MTTDPWVEKLREAFMLDGAAPEGEDNASYVACQRVLHAALGARDKASAFLLERDENPYRREYEQDEHVPYPNLTAAWDEGFRAGVLRGESGR